MDISTPDIKQDDTFSGHDDFVHAVRSYAHKNGFSIRLGKVEKKGIKQYVKEQLYAHAREYLTKRS